jgi:4-aminobutyrate aminotransferase/(S)-3-amino-2-methylpropionate transaminase
VRAASSSPAEGFLPTLVEYAREKGIVFVADEVQAGFARTGKMFASEWEGIVPDLITTAKGIAGGLPLSAVTGRAEIMDSVGPGRLGGTYGGNPVACAAALGAIASYEEDGLAGRAEHIGEVIVDRLTKLQSKYPEIGDIRGRGAMIAAEIVEHDSIEPNADLTKKLAEYCAKNGVVVLTTGTFGNILRFLPPLTISDELLHDAFDVIEAGPDRTPRLTPLTYYPTAAQQPCARLLGRRHVVVRESSGGRVPRMRSWHLPTGRICRLAC